MALVLIFDCGATNLRTIVMDEKGKIIASHHTPNQTKLCPDNKNYHFWDFEQIWYKLQHCAEKTFIQLQDKGISLSNIKGISVTTFGVDGAPFDKNGQQLYPIISWKCPRTLPIMENLSKYLNVKDLYLRNGVGQYSFNTLFKLIWLKENQPKIFEKMDKWVFISSMITHRLTGNLTTDRTMAGTSMMTNLNTGDWDNQVLEVLGLTPNHFPSMYNPGEKVGTLTISLAKKFGLNEIPVFSCGHDTQFAVFGSGAKKGEAVLSSGTWEILMARTDKAYPQVDFISDGLTTELDAENRYFNPAVQWVGSGVMEWIGKLLFTDVFNTEAYYPTMISEGELAPPGAKGVHLEGCFAATEDDYCLGKITGLSMHHTRGQIYRAALEYMALKLKHGLKVLNTVSGLQPQSLICVGGGSKNMLWNQIRADILNIPIDIVDVAESTVLGAAMFTFAGLGVYPNIEIAQDAMQPQKKRIVPGINQQDYAKWLTEINKKGKELC